MRKLVQILGGAMIMLLAIVVVVQAHYIGRITSDDPSKLKQRQVAFFETPETFGSHSASQRASIKAQPAAVRLSKPSSRHLTPEDSKPFIEHAPRAVSMRHQAPHASTTAPVESAAAGIEKDADFNVTRPPGTAGRSPVADQFAPAPQQELQALEKQLQAIKRQIEEFKRHAKPAEKSPAATQQDGILNELLDVSAATPQDAIVDKKKLQKWIKQLDQKYDLRAAQSSPGVDRNWADDALRQLIVANPDAATALERGRVDDFRRLMGAQSSTLIDLLLVDDPEKRKEALKDFIRQSEAAFAATQHQIEETNTRIGRMHQAALSLEKSGMPDMAVELLERQVRPLRDKLAAMKRGLDHDRMVVEKLNAYLSPYTVSRTPSGFFFERPVPDEKWLKRSPENEVLKEILKEIHGLREEMQGIRSDLRAAVKRQGCKEISGRFREKEADPAMHGS